MRRGAGLCLVAALAAGNIAYAQEHPSLLPSRDVAVTYHVSGATPDTHRSSTVRIYFTAHGDKMRIEPEGQPGYSIMDRTAGRMSIIMLPEHTVVQLPYDRSRVMAFDATGVQLIRVGRETVAGLGCAVYEEKRQGRSGKVCLTDDGVLLRAHNDDPAGGGDLEAVQVNYGPQPADLFALPPGFKSVDLPSPPPNAVPGQR